MSYSLYAAIVPSYLQVLRGSLSWLANAEDFATAEGKTVAEMMDARLAPDMLPFNRQVRGFAMHAQGGIEGAMGGVFSPDPTPAPTTFAGLNERVATAIRALEALDPGAVDALEGKQMRFIIGSTNLPFLADQFLLSFSQPNFYFHTTTAYAILRNLGMTIGKMDYLAQLRTM